MATMHRLPLSGVGESSASNNYPSYRAGTSMPPSDQFPAGLRVMVVDDDICCLRILERMLRRCLYTVTLCSQSTAALNMLRDRRGCFDVVLSDVHMPDMDGYKLLEHVGLEMDLPVIMMSADDTTSAVMRGIKHGACDYLVKPIREEELKNIWQHVVRKKCNENKDIEHCDSVEDTYHHHKRGNADLECASSVNEESDGASIAQKKRRDSKDDDDGELDNDDSSTSKKPRVVWSVELHQQFVSAVNHLGIDKAVPKRILELMNVPGLTRENVASHLQKFRLYLKRLNGVAQVQAGVSHAICGPDDPSARLGSLGRFDIHALAASGQIPPQTLAALHAEFLGQPTGKSFLPTMDRPTIRQPSHGGSSCVPVEQGNMFIQPCGKGQSNISKPLSGALISAENVSTSCSVWPSNSDGTRTATGTLESLVPHSTDLFIHKSEPQQHLQQQEQLQQQRRQQPSAFDTGRSIIVQPSCVITPSQSLANHRTSTHGSVGQICNFNRNSAVDGCIPSQPISPSVGVGQSSDRNLKSTDIPSSFLVRESFSPMFSSCLFSADRTTNQHVQSASKGFPANMPQPGLLEASFAAKSSHEHELGLSANTGGVRNSSYFPGRYVAEAESTLANWDQGKTNTLTDGGRVKQETDLDHIDHCEMYVPELQQYSPDELMRVISE